MRYRLEFIPKHSQDIDDLPDLSGWFSLLHLSQKPIGDTGKLSYIELRESSRLSLRPHELAEGGSVHGSSFPIYLGLFGRNDRSENRVIGLILAVKSCNIGTFDPF